jgi:hypothetical protein
MDAKLMCFDCKHLNEDGFGCKAFPDGIPVEITDQGLKHDKPLKDQDNNIVFEKQSKKS